MNDIADVITMGHSRFEFGLVTSVANLRLVRFTLVNYAASSPVAGMRCHDIAYMQIDRLQNFMMEKEKYDSNVHLSEARPIAFPMYSFLTISSPQRRDSLWAVLKKVGMTQTANQVSPWWEGKEIIIYKKMTPFVFHWIIQDRPERS